MSDTDVIPPVEPRRFDGWWTIRLRSSLAERLGGLARARGVSIATVANEAVTEWLAGQDDAPPHGIARPELPGQLSSEEVLRDGI